jgi:hypothetical protein
MTTSSSYYVVDADAEDGDRKTLVQQDQDRNDAARAWHERGCSNQSRGGPCGIEGKHRADCRIDTWFTIM